MEATQNMNMNETIIAMKDTIVDSTMTIESWEDIVTDEKPVEKKITEKVCVAPVISAAKLKAEANRNKALCRAFYDGNDCTHPECFFAHRVEDLRIGNCNFGDKCRKITAHHKTGALIDHPRESFPCNRKHPGESMDSFYNRVGLSKFKGIVIIPKPRKPEEKPVKPVEEKPKKNYKKAVDPSPVVFKKTLEQSPVVLMDSNISSSSVEIPKEMALEALKLLLASGKKISINFK